MPVTFDSSATSFKTIVGSSATGATSATHTVSTIATNLYAVAAVSWSGTVNPSGAAFTVTFGGHTMTEVTGGQQIWENNEGITLLYYLQNPPSGPQTVTASFSGMPVGGSTQYLSLASATYSGTAAVSSATTAAGGGTSAQVIVPAATGEMVVNAFTTANASGLGPITGYNQTSRYNVGWVSGSHFPLAIGDAAGASSVTFTAADTTATSWAGAGVELQGSTVAYDATGVGAAAPGGVLPPSNTTNWTHTIGSTGNVVLVFATALSTDPNLTLSAWIGSSTALTQIGSVMNFYSWNAPYNFSYLPFYTHFFAFGLLRPPTGSQTITITSGSNAYLAANSVSYSGVTSFGNVITAAAPLATLQVPSNVPADRVVAAYGVSPMVNTFSYNQVKRAIVATGADQLLLLGDGPGAAGSVTSTATMSAPNGNWGAVGVNLTPSPVILNASTLIGPILTSSTLADYRSHTPSPVRTYVVPATGVQPVLTNGRLGPQWTQANDSVLDYTFDWTNWLESTADSIAHVTFTPSDPSVQVISTNVDGAIATGWLTGGITGDVYSIVVHITTIDGRQDDRTFTLIISQT